MKKLINNIYTIYGCGGFGREVMPLLRAYIANLKKNLNSEFYFIDDFQIENNIINSTKVFNFENFIKNFNNSKIHCCIAITNKEIRKKLTQKCIDNGFSMMSVISANSVIMNNVRIGDGSIISPFATITSNISIGKSFHCNIYSYVGHDCVIGDFVTFAPGVKCNGNVQIESGVYIGTGAIIYPGTSQKPLIIGKNSKISAGTIVKRNVPENVTVFSAPIRLFKRENIEIKKND